MDHKILHLLIHACLFIPVLPKPIIISMFCPAMCSGKGICDWDLPKPICKCFDPNDLSTNCSNKRPSLHPSVTPSTVEPTIYFPETQIIPTKDISLDPTRLPTLAPSVSSEPSKDPTAHPTVSTEPSIDPTTKPSSEPSSVPSRHPSETPSTSQSPTKTHSSSPSEAPSISQIPTKTPSTVPSGNPTTSRSPTRSPYPSAEPTLEPKPKTERISGGMISFPCITSLVLSTIFSLFAFT